MRIRQAAYRVIDPVYAYSGAGRIYNIGMLILIFLNVLAVVLETETAVYSRYAVYFRVFEVFSVVIFTIEYILRLWTCVENSVFHSPLLGRLRFAIQPSMLIDLFSFLPFYIPLGGMDLRFIRAVRLFRLFRLLKLGRYSQSLTKLVKVVRDKKEELLITLFSGVVVLVIASSIMYFIEREAQPDTFGSIPKAMWWGVATLTTVGYGDVYPTTGLGRFIGSFIAVLGIGLFALPAGIIASGFASEIQKERAEIKVCPHCGKSISK